jgi:TRAP transporter 4TM/12TM fusion protein
LTDEFFYRQTEAFVIGIILIPLTIEALRRTAGWSLTSIVLAFFVYAFWGDFIPGKLEGRAQALESLVPYIAVDNVALFGLPMTIVCTIVVMFIFMGQLLLKSGGSEWFTDIACALMGRSRGGSAKIAVVASGLFGSISGSAVSNVASTGVITIPMMRQAGYEPKVAGAFEAVASTGGQIMPPIMGAAAFLMAEFLEIAYTEVVAAAIIPAALYYVAVFFYADLEAGRKNIPPVPEDQIPPLLRTLKEGWFFTLPFAVLIYALFALNISPEEAALWASVCIVAVNWIFGYKGRRMSLRDIYNAIHGTGRGAVDIVIIGAMAGMIIGIIEVTGLGFGLTFVLVEFGEGNLLGLMVLTAVICIVLGMGMPTTAIYFLVATLAAPPLIKLGVNPLAAHMFVLYFGLVSLITPPVAVAAFVAANLAGAQPMETAVTSVRIGWTALVVPMMFVLSPNLIMQGELLDILIAVVTAFFGVWLATAGIMRYFVRPMGLTLCVGFVIAGLALLLPARAFDGAGYIDIAGVALALLLTGKEWYAKRQSPAV